MVEWVKIATNVAVGGGAGAIDQLLQNEDEKREAEEGKKLGILSQYGTYYDYGVPILAVLATAFGLVRGEWAARLTSVGSTLAGRKATWHITKKERVVAFQKWTRNAQLGAERQAMIAAGDKVVGQLSTGNLLTIPIISGEGILA